MHQRKGSKKGRGPSHCHYCGRQLQYKLGGGFYFTELLTPYDKYLIRVHVTHCVEDALREGYSRPTTKEQNGQLQTQPSL